MKFGDLRLVLYIILAFIGSYMMVSNFYVKDKNVFEYNKSVLNEYYLDIELLDESCKANENKIAKVEYFITGNGDSIYELDCYKSENKKKKAGRFIFDENTQTYYLINKKDEMKFLSTDSTLTIPIQTIGYVKEELKNPTQRHFYNFYFYE